MIAAARYSADAPTPLDYYTPAQQDALAGMLHHEFDRLMAAETEELERLTTNRDRLESEQDRLMHAHYADAIPLSVLRREQDRIVAELDQVTRRVDAHFGDYADALGLLANCADIYTRCEDTNRRLCNQAFFTKVFIDEDNELRVEHNRPFEILLDPQVNANALTWAADANKARTSTNVFVGKGSSLVRAVELRGLEPLTPCMPCRCATSCAIAPYDSETLPRFGQPRLPGIHSRTTSWDRRVSSSPERLNHPRQFARTRANCPAAQGQSARGAASSSMSAEPADGNWTSIAGQSPHSRSRA